MAKLRSAAELDARGDEQAALWQQIRRTALDQVDSFCRSNNLQPAEFMSAMGWLRQGSWRSGVDWRECVDWNQMNSVILSNISPNRRGLDIRGFHRDLESGQAGYSEETARPQQPPARRAPERRQEAPAAQEQEAPGRRQRNPAMSAQTWAVAFSQSDEILSNYPSLTEEHRNAIQNIIDLSAPESRRLVDMNLRSYMRHLNEQRVLSVDQSDRLFSQLMVVVQGAEQAILAGRRGPTRSMPIQPERRLAAAGLTPREGTPAPEREERFVYRMTVYERGKALSSFEISSPTEINSAQDFLRMIQSPPAGMAVTRVWSTGERVALNEQEIETMQRRFDEMRGQDKYSIRLERQA